MSNPLRTWVASASGFWARSSVGLLGVALACSACGTSSEGSSAEQLGSTSNTLDESKAAGDGTAELKVRNGDLTVWLSPLLDTQLVDGQRVYRLYGRASTKLASVESSGLEGALGTASLLDHNRFRLQLSASDTKDLLSGAPVYLRFTPLNSALEPASGEVRIGSKYLNMKGDIESIDIDADIRPYLVNSEVVHRTYLVLADGLAAPTVSGQPIHVPAMQAVTDSRYRLEYSTARLLEADYDLQSVTFSAKRADGSALQATARVDLYVKNAALAVDVPALAFPPESCATDVVECVESLPQCVAGDTEACGTAWAVSRCRDDAQCSVEVGSTPLFGTEPYRGIEEHFPADLGNFLANYYEEHSAQVATEGGSTLEEALSLIDPELVEFIANAADAPQDHDLTENYLFRHPDVIHPGAGRYLWGLYNQDSGALQDLYLH